MRDLLVEKDEQIDELVKALKFCFWVVGGGYVGSGHKKKDLEKQAAEMAKSAIEKVGGKI